MLAAAASSLPAFPRSILAVDLLAPVAAVSAPVAAVSAPVAAVSVLAACESHLAVFVPTPPPVPVA
jgi:hypothetical protein